MRSLLFAGVGVAFFSLAGPTLAAGRHLCWVSDAKADGTEVDIRFFGPVGGTKTAGTTENRLGFSASQNGVTLRDKDGRALETVPALALRVGDTVFVSTFPEDVCTLTVKANNGTIVLEAEAAGQTPDHRPTSSREIIPVELAQKVR